MFGFLHVMKKNRELEYIMERIDSNVANNYKDAAQEYLSEFETKLQKLKDDKKLNDEQISHYESELENYKNRLKEFKHKDQKPYWT